MSATARVRQTRPFVSVRRSPRVDVRVGRLTDDADGGGGHRGTSGETGSRPRELGLRSSHSSSDGRLVMAESEKAKAGRLQKRREEQQAKRERTGDTLEAQAERQKQAHAEDYDADVMKKRVGNPGAALLS